MCMCVHTQGYIYNDQDMSKLSNSLCLSCGHFYCIYYQVRHCWEIDKVTTCNFIELVMFKNVVWAKNLTSQASCTGSTGSTSAPILYQKTILGAQPNVIKCKDIYIMQLPSAPSTSTRLGQWAIGLTTSSHIHEHGIGQGYAPTQLRQS